MKSCEENQEKISALLDAELSPKERTVLKKHLSMCVKCQTLEEWLRCIKEGVGKSAADLVISDAVRDKILTVLPDLPAKEKPLPWWRRFF